MEKTQGLHVAISKEFNVPVERLYKAWTAEEELRQWWHPMENTLKQMTNELRNGGKVSYQFANSDGQEAFTITGVYKEVEEAKKLVYTWNWQLPTAVIQDSDFLLTITFESAGNGSKLHVKQENFTSEEAVHPHQEGWEKALNDLADYLQA